MFSDCQLAQNVRVEILATLHPHPGGLPIFGTGLPACDEMALQIVVRDPVTSAVFTAIGPQPTNPNSRNNFILAKYVRTWLGLGPDGVTEFRFWRYMIEGDGVNFTATPNIPSSYIPACYSPGAPNNSFPNVCFRGYLDLMNPAEDSAPPDPGQIEYTIVLSHYDGCLDHLDTPLNLRAISGQPPSKHVGTSYHLVSPEGFNWLANAPGMSRLDLAAVSTDSLRSTVSHTTTMGHPGPMCLGESPVHGVLNSSTLTCNCVSGTSPGMIDYNQLFPFQVSYAGCSQLDYWHSFYLVPEIPTGFTQTYLGEWDIMARPDLSHVQALLNVGTIEYLDRCAARYNYYSNTGRITWGNATLVPNIDVPNAPHPGPGTIPTDYLLHFGNHQDQIDQNTVGTPGYVNIIWTLHR